MCHGIEQREADDQQAELPEFHSRIEAPKSNGQPLSLGVIPVGGLHQVTLTDTARQALSQSRTLAISLEPVGGSPTGKPTGPILHVAKLYEL